MLPQVGTRLPTRRHPRGTAYTAPRQRCLVVTAVAVGFISLWLLAAYVILGGDGGGDHGELLPPPPPARYDVVIVPGGGLDAEREAAAWVKARLDAALLHDAHTDYYLVLSRGTTHKPPPLDGGGFPIDESAASAQYLVSHGVDASRVLLESWSLDTIGNAAFARLMHADLRGWLHILVITSAFHMPRTRAIFDWVFSLEPRRPNSKRSLRIDYEEVAESGLADEAVLESRRQKEAQALQTLRATTMAEVPDLAALHAFLFVKHGAYRARTAEELEAARTRAAPHVAGGALGLY